MNFLKTLTLTLCLSSPLANAGNDSMSTIVNPALAAMFVIGATIVWDNAKTLHNAIGPNRQFLMHNHEPVMINRQGCIKGVMCGLGIMTASVLSASILYVSNTEACEKQG